MAFERYITPTTRTGVNMVKRYNGSEWVDCNAIKRYDGSEWVDVWTSGPAFTWRLNSTLNVTSYVAHLDQIPLELQIVAHRSGMSSTLSIRSAETITLSSGNVTVTADYEGDSFTFGRTSSGLTYPAAFPYSGTRTTVTKTLGSAYLRSGIIYLGTNLESDYTSGRMIRIYRLIIDGVRVI